MGNAPAAPQTAARQTFAILHGLAEGPLLSRRLRHTMVRAGFAPAKTAASADIIIAHSAGSLLITPDYSASLYVHINASYWNSRALASSAIEKVLYDLRLRRARKQTRRWLLSFGANAFYMFNLRHGLKLRKPYFSPMQALASLPAGRHVFIRNRDDSYCRAEQLIHSVGAQHVLLALPGNHDDCWRDPHRYADVVRSFCGPHS